MYEANAQFTARMAQGARRHGSSMGGRGSSVPDIGYVELYVVKNFVAQQSPDRPQYDISEFYRGKDSQANMQIGKHPGIL